MTALAMTTALLSIARTEPLSTTGVSMGRAAASFTLEGVVPDPGVFVTNPDAASAGEMF
jgi:hypothetical protein